MPQISVISVIELLPFLFFNHKFSNKFSIKCLPYQKNIIFIGKINLIKMNNIQKEFLQNIKQSIHPGLSFVDEIAEVLSVSNDSAYRRIRGETPLTIQEAEKLCLHFGVSIDSFLGIKSNIVTFRYRSLNPLSFDFGAYLNNILLDLQRIDSFAERDIIYMAKDIPLFYLFLFPELASFKIFFWQRSLCNFRNTKTRVLN